MATQPAIEHEDYRYEHVTMDVLRHDMQFDEGKPGPGDRMPEFDLVTTDGQRIKTTEHVGRKPALLIFGSVSCPMTASSVPDLKRLHGEFGDSFAFTMLNVREAHPGEDIPQPDSFDEKLDHARVLKDRYDISWTVAVDSVAGTIHRALDPKPNAAYVVDRDGIIAFRSLWAGDESGLRQALQSVVRGEAPPERESRRRLLPMAKGMGEMRQVLRRSGPRAERDIWRAAPPMALVAWLAGPFTPLPNAWRAFAAMTVVAVLMVAIVAALVWWLI